MEATSPAPARARRVASASAPFRPIVTIGLVALNVLVFIWEYATGTNDQSNESLAAHGALFGPYVTYYGQWWRIVTSAFLHIGFAHLALNMLALFQLGQFVEYQVGRWRMLAIYLLSMVGGGIAVVYFSPNEVTAGASGAIFGLFGALIAIGLRLGKAGRPLIRQTLPILLINLAFTFAIPFISKAGHLGGAATGFVAGLLFFVMRPAPPPPATATVVDEATGEAQEAEVLDPDSRPVSMPETNVVEHETEPTHEAGQPHEA